MTSSGGKSSPDDGWQESCDLTKEGKSQVDQQSMKEKDMTSSGGKSSPHESWGDTDDLHQEWNSKFEQEKC